MSRKTNLPLNDSSTVKSVEATVPLNLASIDERVAKLESALESLLAMEERLGAENKKETFS